MQRRKLLPLSLCALWYCSSPAQAALNDVAVFAPGVDNWMMAQQQKELATYLKSPGLRGDKSDHLTSPGQQTKIYDHANQSDLVAWMQQRMSDGKSDVLLIIDLAPAQVFNDNDNSLAEAWMENGNMLIWTGSEPFRASVDAGGAVTDHAADGINDGANKVLDIKGENLCMGYSSVPQQETSVASAASDFYDYLPSLNLNYTGQDMRSLSYIDVLTEAKNVVSPNDAPQIVIDEIFAENSDLQDTAHVYESDAIVLTMRQTANDRKGMGGQYAQFYCYKGLVDGVDSNEHRKPVLYEFLHNWVAKNIDLIHVQAGATNGDGSEAKPYGTIQAGINAAGEFSRDRVVVMPGVYNEQIKMKRSVKLISSGDDMQGNIVGYLDDFNNPELQFTYNTVPQVNAKKGLLRAEKTVIDGAELPSGDPMINFRHGATLGTWIDGFTIQNMPIVDQSKCGSARTIQIQGGSPLLINNIVLNNGGPGVEATAVFNTNSKGDSVKDNICQNDDFRYDNVLYDAHPALINNIIGANDGPNLSDDYYAYSIMYHNELFKSGYFGDDLPEPFYDAPGIKAQHGAHPYIYSNAIYDSSRSGIDARRGVNELTWENKVDRPTRPVILDNYVLNSGTAGLQESGAGIGALNTGGHDPYSEQNLYQIIDGNFIHTAAKGGVSCLYNGDEDGGTTTIPQNNVGYVVINNNTGTQAGTAGIEIHGCANVFEISHNEMTANTRAGIGIAFDAKVGDITDNLLHSNGMAGIGMKEGAQVVAIRNNSLLKNGAAGIGHNGSAKRVVVGEEVGNTIESNGAAGIGMIHAEVNLISMNTIRFNGAPGITVTEDSDVGLIEGSAATEGSERLSQNGRGDLQDPISNKFTAGLVVLNEGSTANISNLIVEGSGMVNVMLGPGTVVTMDGCTIRNNHHQGPNLRIDGKATVTNNLFENAKHPGVIIVGEDAFVTFNDNIISKTGTAGILINQGPTIKSFAGNQVLQAGTAGILLGTITGDLHIIDSDINGSGTIGILAKNFTHNLTITNSNIRNSGTIGIYLLSADRSKSLYIKESHIVGNNIIGMKVVHNDNLSIIDSTINDNGGPVMAYNVANVEVINSIIKDNWAGMSLFIEDKPAATCIVSNSIFDNNVCGPDIQMRGGSLFAVYDTIVSGTGPSGSDGGHAIRATGVNSVDVVRCDLRSWSTGIQVKGAEQANVSKSRIRARWPIWFENSHGTVTNTITGTNSDGYLFFNSTVNLYNNTMYGGTSKWTPDGSGDKNQYGFKAMDNSVVHAYNNIVTGVQFGFLAQSGSVVTADYNLMHGNQFNHYAATANPGVMHWGANNIVNTDPEMVDPLNEDFHLKSSSPAIDAGDSTIEVFDDMDGDARPQGNGVDIGADEIL